MFPKTPVLVCRFTQKEIDAVTPRERFVKALTFDRPDRAPRDLWALAGIGMFRQAEFDQLLQRYPLDLTNVGSPFPKSPRVQGAPSTKGIYIDEWGTEWVSAEDGVIGEVKNPILADWDKLADWQPPHELIDGADWDAFNRKCEATDVFRMAGGEVRPFERMQFLRGTENILLDVAFQSPEFFELRDRIHAWNVRYFEGLAKSKVDAFFMMDDWGSQTSLLISPDMWRELFKPLYKEYCDIAHANGKFFMMHSDGYTESIIPDLIEIGVNALNTQIFCMNIEELAKQFKGKITFYGEIDRQNILPFGTPDDVRAAVRRVRAALDDGTGGCIAQCEWGNTDPRENIEAVFETWME